MFATKEEGTTVPTNGIQRPRLSSIPWSQEHPVPRDSGTTITEWKHTLSAGSPRIFRRGSCDEPCGATADASQAGELSAVSDGQLAFAAARHFSAHARQCLAQVMHALSSLCFSHSSAQRSQAFAHKAMSSAAIGPLRADTFEQA